jgi:hypothetical protein
MAFLVCVRHAFSSIAGFDPDTRATDRVLEFLICAISFRRADYSMVKNLAAVPRPCEKVIVSNQRETRRWPIASKRHIRPGSPVRCP